MRSSLLLATALVACSTSLPPAPPPPSAHEESAGRAALEADVARELDDFHDAAAHADEARYFAHFASGGVFLGTDATERWDVAAFRAYAHQRFSAGKGWVYRPTRRAISIAPSGEVAWFDEDLMGEKAGPTRGSGVFVRRNGRYLLAQYVLSVTVPNDRFDAVRTAIDAPKKDVP